MLKKLWVGLNTFDLDVTVFNRCDVRRIGRNMVLMITSTSFDSFLAFSGLPGTSTHYALQRSFFMTRSCWEF